MSIIPGIGIGIGVGVGVACSIPIIMGSVGIVAVSTTAAVIRSGIVAGSAFAIAQSFGDFLVSISSRKGSKNSREFRRNYFKSKRNQ